MIDVAIYNMGEKGAIWKAKNYKQNKKFPNIIVLNDQKK